MDDKRIMEFRGVALGLRAAGYKFAADHMERAADTIQSLTADLARVTAERDARDARIEALGLIDALRATEGHSVTICHDNPDFSGANCTIFVSQDYGATDKQYFGDTILDCLRQAQAALGGNNAE